MEFDLEAADAADWILYLEFRQKKQFIIIFPIFFLS